MTVVVEPPSTSVRPQLAFSTLACPEWSADEVVDQAAAIGYDAIEWRGGEDGHVIVDWPISRRHELRQRMTDAGVSALAVTSYTSFVSGDERVRRDGIDSLRRHLDLASDIGAGTVRAFVGEIDDATPWSALIDRALEGLRAALDGAPDGAVVGIEPHDDFARSAAIEPILAHLDPRRVGVVWDPVNSWGVGERPSTGLAAVRERIRYVQLKDARWVGGDWELVPLGEGEAPWEDALRELSRTGSMPPLSLEWERVWHPDLAPAEIALPQALAVMRRHLAGSPPGADPG